MIRLLTFLLLWASAAQAQMMTPIVWDAGATKFYFEAQLTQEGGLSQLLVGVGSSRFAVSQPIDTAIAGTGRSQAEGAVISFSVAGPSLGWGYPVRAGAGIAYTVGDWVGVAVDTKVGRFWWRNATTNSGWAGNGGASPNPATGVNGFDISTQVPRPLYIVVGSSKFNFDGDATASIVTLNAGASAFVQAAPTGYIAWDTSGSTTLNPATNQHMTLGIAVDLDHTNMWNRSSNGLWSTNTGVDDSVPGDPATNTLGNSITSVTGGNVFPALTVFQSGQSVTINAGPTFYWSVPSGFTAWDASGATTWDPANKDASITLSNGNLTATGTVASSNRSARATTAHTSGKWYYEVTIVIPGADGPMIGVENASGVLNNYIASTADGAGYNWYRLFQINAGALANAMGNNMADYLNRDIRVTLSGGNLVATTTMPSPFGTPPFAMTAMARSTTSRGQ